jgi:nucleotide-binding universal stress UspA family protein
LTIIHVIRPHDGMSYATRSGIEAARHLLLRVAEDAKALAPNVAIGQDLVRDASVPRALLNASRGAALIVVGSTGHGVLKGTVGSAAHAVLHHATGPVLISRN